MHHLHRVEGRGTLSAPGYPVLSVEFYYDVFDSEAMLDMRGRIISDDFQTLSAWFHNLTKLTLQTDTFSLQFCLSDEDGHFRATEGPALLE